MRRITKRIKVTPNMRRLVKATGQVVVCRQGGWPTHRIHFEEPSSEPYRDASSEPLSNGQAYIARELNSSEFWISTSTVGAEPEDIILDVIDCATPVVEIGRHFGGVEFHVLLNTGGTPIETEGETWFTFYQDEQWATDESDGITDTTRRHVLPRGSLGGGVSCSEDFELHVYERLTWQGSTFRALVAGWYADKKDADNRFSISFDFGALPAHQVNWQDGILGSCDLRWPLIGLEIAIKTPGAANVEALIYERTPRT